MPLLALLPALTPQPNPAATRSPPPPLPPECDAVTYAIHKPRGVLSAARDADPTRRCLTDVMVDAGVAPVAGHVGRLDLDTSGLILVTADGLLLEAALNIPRGEVAASESTAPLTKTYQLLLQGRHEAGTAAVLSLGEPLTHRRGGREFHSDAAASVSVLRCFQSPELATEYALIDRDDHAAVARERAKLREARRPRVSRASGAERPAYIPCDGWLTEVELVIAQGRHHQIRRLCKRAGLRLLHLRRVAVGPIGLGSMAPGEVRALSDAAKAALYGACRPRLQGAHQRRQRAMAAARARGHRSELRAPWRQREEKR